jgi:hypothetical protein
MSLIIRRETLEDVYNASTPWGANVPQFLRFLADRNDRFAGRDQGIDCTTRYLREIAERMDCAMLGVPSSIQD